MQKVKLAAKPAASQGSKDDIFGTGQPKQRRCAVDHALVYLALVNYCLLSRVSGGHHGKGLRPSLPFML